VLLLELVRKSVLRNCHMPLIIEDVSERVREKTCSQSRKSGARARSIFQSASGLQVDVMPVPSCVPNTGMAVRLISCSRTTHTPDPVSSYSSL